jgi:molecular chaperone Hsp33
MRDELITALWGAAGIRLAAASATGVAQQATARHHARPAAASLLGQALTGAALISALQLDKGGSRTLLQLECDGALRGLMAEADAQGHLRGYVKNPLVEVEGGHGPFRFRPALGNRGYLSVLRERADGQFFRSAVELEAFELGADLQRFFEVSEQVDTWVRLVSAVGAELAGQVGGVVAQRLPGGDPVAFAALRERFEVRRLDEPGGQVVVEALLSEVAPWEGLEITARYPLTFSCPCSKERVSAALLSVGRAELEDILAKEGKAEVTCHFCASHHELGREELVGLLARLPP